MHKKRKQYRLPGFNYATNTAYFVTIVCSNRDCFLGEIVNDEMKYSRIGEIALDELLMARKHKKDVKIPEFVIMPNHIHLIVILENEVVSEVPAGSILPLGDGFVRSGRIGPLQKGSLGAFVNRYKGRITRRCREEGFVDFGWQQKYNDRIIRGAKEYSIIAQYINDNISKWDGDTKRKG